MKLTDEQLRQAYNAARNADSLNAFMCVMDDVLVAAPVAPAAVAPQKIAESAQEVAQPDERAEPAYYGLSDANVGDLLGGTLKPEEISGAAEVQHDRVRELMHWFARFKRGAANPKWLQSHAFELAYFIAVNGMNRSINLDDIRQKAYIEGVNITPQERRTLERIGVVAAALQAGATLTDAQVSVIGLLIDLARATHRALDDSEEGTGDDGRFHAIDGQNFDDVSDALDKLEELPDDKPGCTLNAAGKAEWALRALLARGGNQ